MPRLRLRLRPRLRLARKCVFLRLNCIQFSYAVLWGDNLVRSKLTGSHRKMKVKLWGISSLVHSVDQISAGRACFKMLHKKKTATIRSWRTGLILVEKTLQLDSNKDGLCCVMCARGNQSKPMFSLSSSLCFYISVAALPL